MSISACSGHSARREKPKPSVPQRAAAGACRRGADHLPPIPLPRVAGTHRPGPPGPRERARLRLRAVGSERQRRFPFLSNRATLLRHQSSWRRAMDLETSARRWGCATALLAVITTACWLTAYSKLLEFRE